MKNKSISKNTPKRRKTLKSIIINFEYKHTTAAIITIVLFVLALDTAIVKALIDEIVGLGLIGVFLAGMLFVSFFTAAPAIVLLATFTQDYNIFVVSLIGGLGAMLGDWIILKTFEDKIGSELVPLAKKLKLMDFISLLHKKSYAGITATIGAIIIASPLPDEAGLALLGLSKISTIKLLVLTFVLNAAGIYILLVIF